MIRILKWLALAMLMLSLNSCGWIGALARSGGRVVQAVAAAA